MLKFAEDDIVTGSSRRKRGDHCIALGILQLVKSQGLDKQTRKSNLEYTIARKQKKKKKPQGDEDEATDCEVEIKKLEVALELGSGSERPKQQQWPASASPSFG